MPPPHSLRHQHGGDPCSGGPGPSDPTHRRPSPHPKLPPHDPPHERPPLIPPEDHCPPPPLILGVPDGHQAVREEGHLHAAAVVAAVAALAPPGARQLRIRHPAPPLLVPHAGGHDRPAAASAIACSERSGSHARARTWSRMSVNRATSASRSRYSALVAFSM